MVCRLKTFLVTEFQTCIHEDRIETDYSDGDMEQIRTRIEALLECVRPC